MHAQSIQSAHGKQYISKQRNNPKVLPQCPINAPGGAVFDKIIAMNEACLIAWDPSNPDDVDFDAEDAERRKDPEVDAKVRTLARKYHLGLVANPEASASMANKTNPWMARCRAATGEAPVLGLRPNLLTRVSRCLECHPRILMSKF